MKILVLFSTMMGTTGEVAKRVEKNLTESDNEVNLYNIFDNPHIDFSGYEMVVIGAPTYDEGLEYGMRDYIEQHNPDLSQQKIAVFGLGDKIYPEYCTAVDILEKWVIKNNGTLSIQSLRIDGYPTDMKDIDAWTNQIHLRHHDKT